MMQLCYVAFVAMTFPLMLMHFWTLSHRRELSSGLPISTSSDKMVNKNSSLVAHKRWAVMMIGGARTYAFTRKSFIQNVVNQTNPPMDVFVSTSSTTSCSVDSFSSVLLELDSTAWRYHESIEHGNPDYQTRDRFYTEQMGVLKLIDDYSKQKNVTYDYIFYARPDLYYTVPFNIKKLEKTLDNNNGTIFSPECCAYGGWCDRLAAARYIDFSHLIRVSDEWFAKGNTGIWEVAFKNRGQYANLSNFDMHIYSNLTEDYGFVTMRLGVALEECAPNKTLWYENTTDWYFWCDYECNNMGPISLNPTPAACNFLNRSLARKEKCTKLK